VPCCATCACLPRQSALSRRSGRTQAAAPLGWPSCGQAVWPVRNRVVRPSPGRALAGRSSREVGPLRPNSTQCTDSNYKSFFYFQFDSNIFQTSKIHINSIIGPKIHINSNIWLITKPDATSYLLQFQSLIHHPPIDSSNHSSITLLFAAVPSRK
jgi:hypothetical protein